MNGKRILVTGGARGIGGAITSMAAKAGAVVGVNYLTSEQAATELLAQYPNQVILLKADVRDQSAVETMVKKFVEKAGGIDVLVNNAGVALAPAKLLIRQSESDIRLTVETNLIGAMFTTQAALHHMTRQRSGLVVFHSSVAANIPRPGLTVYTAAKAGLEAFASGVALESRRRGIRTVCLRLGPCATAMYATRAEPERKRIEERLLDGIVPCPEAVARFIAALVNSEDCLLDGTIVTLDSGYSLGLE